MSLTCTAFIWTLPVQRCPALVSLCHYKLIIVSWNCCICNFIPMRRGLRERGNRRQPIGQRLLQRANQNTRAAALRRGGGVALDTLYDSRVSKYRTLTLSRGFSVERRKRAKPPQIHIEKRKQSKQEDIRILSFSGDRCIPSLITTGARFGLGE